MSRLFSHLGALLTVLAVFLVPTAAQQNKSGWPSDYDARGLQTIASEAFPGASISYKQVRVMSLRMSL